MILDDMVDPIKRGAYHQERLFDDVAPLDDSDCVNPDPANTVTDRLNIALNSSGPGFILRLCPNRQYLIQEPIRFAFPDQEISTVGYPTDDSRAVLVVNGPVANGQGHTTAIEGRGANLNGCRLRNIQVNGTRLGAPPTGGDANIEMGGSNADQLVEYVRSFDPRSWSCLHIAEGDLSCRNVTVQNNDIGPCGSDAFQEWADGISVSCASSTIRNNLINNPTDGGIVLFGAPGTLVENNTIWVVNDTLLGGVNMVDVNPWGGNYTGTVVQHNIIAGGFATDLGSAYKTKGSNLNNVIVKIGIAIGPHTWFGGQFSGDSFSGTVLNNQLTGAMSYGIAISSARNFTVQGNTLTGNTSFIGVLGPKCGDGQVLPSPAPFIVDASNTTQMNLQDDFQIIPDNVSQGLTCIVPPDGGDFWPYGGNPAQGNMTPPVPVPEPAVLLSGGGGGLSSGDGGLSSGDGGLSAGAIAGIVIAVLLGVVASAYMTWSIRRWVLKKADIRGKQLGSLESLENKEDQR